MGSNYSALSDVQLTALINKGDEKAFEEIMFRYSKLIYKIAGDYAIDGYDIQDLYQEGLLAFLVAAKHYDEARAASYKNYAVKCAKNKFNDLLKKTKNKSAVPNSQLVPMEALADRHDSNQDIEEHYVEREYLKTLLLHLKSILSNDERMIFDLYLKGYSYKEIAEKAGSTPKAIDNTLQKIKKKLRK